MKLLLDQNLSRKLIKHLRQDYPGSAHVGVLGLTTADDQQIWRYAREHDFAIVTLDADFHDYPLGRTAADHLVTLR